MAKPFKALKNYSRDTGGQFAVQFAVLAFPLLLMTTFVMDYSAAGAEKVHIKSALDAAVIATVNNNSLTTSQKEDYALKHFQENYKGAVQVKLDPKATATRVEMSAKGLAKVSVAAAIGIKGASISEESIAELTSENVICALSLAPDGKDVVTFRGNSSFIAPTCSVHVNSTDKRAMRSVGNAKALAKSFCVGGGSSGSFMPYAKGDCAPVEDPYKHRHAPQAGSCINIGQISDMRGGGSSSGGEGETGGGGTALATKELAGGGGGTGSGTNSGERTENLTGSNVALSPGTYCGGLTVDGVNVRFLPGDHIILDGPLIFRNNATATGDGVTFVMNGLEADLTVESGAAVDLKAPSTGPLAGLAFFQDVQTQLGVDGNLPNGMNRLSSGGRLNITGTAYFPTQTIEVTSNAIFGSHAPATSFIGYDLHFKGSSTINVAVDHQRAGLPPIMPRTEDGALLVQ